MAKYDLTGSLEPKFTFAIGDKEFEFKKPTVREMREIASKFAGIDKEQDTEKQAQMSEEAMATLYGFVTPVGHNEDLKTMIEDQPMGVQLAFNDMIKKELGSGE